VWLAICYALLITSHLFTVLLFSLVPLAYALLLSPGGRLSALLKTAAGMALGVGVAALYLFTALRQEVNIPASALTSLPLYRYTRNFLVVDRRLWTEWSGFQARMGWLTLDTIVVAACFAAMGRRFRQRRELLFWVVVCGLCFALMLPLTAPIWRDARLLQQIQFPWRFNVVVCVGVAAIIAIGLGEIEQRVQAIGLGLPLAAMAFVAMWGAAYFNIWTQYEHQKAYIADRDSVGLAEDRLRYIWLRWTPPALYTPAALQRMAAEPMASFPDVADAARVTSFRARDITLETITGRGGRLVVKQFYYPGWAAEDASGKKLAVTPSQPEGLLQVQVPAGEQRIHLRLAPGPVERISRLMSAASLLLVAALIAASYVGRAGKNEVADKEIFPA
jgi:hypothetical protein